MVIKFNFKKAASLNILDMIHDIYLLQLGFQPVALVGIRVWL